METRLNGDIDIVHKNHEEYVEIFKELKSLGERFCKSLVHFNLI